MDGWAELGGLEAAAEYQVYLLSNTTGAANNLGQFPSQDPGQPDDAVSQYPDLEPADQPGPGATSQGEYQYHSAPPQQSPSRSLSPASSRSRRSSSAVYPQLPSFPPFEDPIPDEATIEDICIRYPNHLRGSYLDAFIQWKWTGNQIYNRLTDRAVEEFKSTGISSSKSVNNRANFLIKRLSARMARFSAEQLDALCNAPKLRGCLVNGGEDPGRCKMEGKVLNEKAGLVRKYRHRQHRARKGRASAAAAAAAEKTVTLNGEEYGLWASAAELETFSRGVAAQWDRQRRCAEEIINADEVHGVSVGRERRHLILQMTNWATNSSTETLFSFQRVEDCPTFITAINDMVATGVANRLSSGPMADLTDDQQVAAARQSAVDYVIAAYAARLERLNNLVATLPAEGFVQGVVDHVLSWNEDVVPEAAFATDATHSLKNPFDGNTATTQEYATGPGELFADPVLMDVDSAAGMPRPMPSQIPPKRASEEPTQQIRSPKRARRAQPSIADEEFLFEASPFADTSSNHDEDVVTTAAAGAAESMFPDGLLMNNGRLGSAVSTSATTWRSSVPTGAVPQIVPQQEELDVGGDTVLPDQASGVSQAGFTCSAGDVVFTRETPLEEVLRDFGIGNVTGDVSGVEEPNTVASETVTRAGATAGAVTDVDSVGTGDHDGAGGDVGPGGNSSYSATLDLPHMINNDEDWLNEAIENAVALGLPDLDDA
ncbi:hypothetical protein G647_10218 [Cladophialophora carrionii CBS 160.54]|uniref:Uncharacterized protein n=1 Tax=Cladophialophora carrionii CBS 160.54 TaxID=1279043 RepID=V9DKC4_9EURO|nr:uncharacterized protein G647_10218 [Cladophialophora carrionii CBS 160.54]ETI26773.1 hypothetical protein G647_10218 [Cladophialophora carrionii CBS 160.54]